MGFIEIFACGLGIGWFVKITARKRPAIGYLHSIGICHRDIKPQNIMVDLNDYTLKLCDFGCAKRLVKGEENISYICSRHYRPPELVLGATEYTTQTDVWSMGCVIAEVVLNETLFRGKSANVVS